MNKDDTKQPREHTSSEYLSTTQRQLIDQIKEITNVPNRTLTFNGNDIESIVWNCGDSVYWKIIRLSKDAIPYLLEKMKDSSITHIVIPCRTNKLRVGTIAYMILNEIIDIPQIEIFGQYDTFEINCDFGFSQGLLKYINNNLQKTSNRLNEWYANAAPKIKKQSIGLSNQTECQKRYGINYKLIEN